MMMMKKNLLGVNISLDYKTIYYYGKKENE